MRDCRVYVINLEKTVLKGRDFQRANPDYAPGMPCVYVGSTCRTAEERFEQHLAGIKSSKYVRKFGRSLRLSECRPALLTRGRAKQRERNLARTFREQGWGVWSK